jgi:hypothetical protein
MRDKSTDHFGHPETPFVPDIRQVVGRMTTFALWPKVWRRIKVTVDDDVHVLVHVLVPSFDLWSRYTKRGRPPVRTASVSMRS